MLGGIWFDGLCECCSFSTFTIYITFVVGVLLASCVCFCDYSLALCRLIIVLLRVGGEASPDVVFGRSSLDRMASDSVVLPPSAGIGPHIPWTSSVALHRFVWAIQLGVGLGSGSRLECRRAALVVWLRKLDISVSGSEIGAPVLSADEEMLDWIVAFIRNSWTPLEILIWYFQFF